MYCLSCLNCWLRWSLNQILDSTKSVLGVSSPLFLFSWRQLERIYVPTTFLGRSKYLKDCSYYSFKRISNWVKTNQCCLQILKFTSKIKTQVLIFYGHRTTMSFFFFVIFINFLIFGSFRFWCARLYDSDSGDEGDWILAESKF